MIKGLGPFLCPVIVGRDDALEVADAAYERAAGSASVLSIAGEAGIGKTRLVVEVIERARSDGRSVFDGAALEVGAGIPYGPILDALHSGPGGDHARRIEHGVPRDAGSRRAQVVSELAAALQGPPTVLILEDLHWSDDATIEIIEPLVRRLRTHPCLLVLSYRPEEIPASLERAHAALRRSGVAAHLSLGPLEYRDVGEMIAAALGHPAHPDLVGRVAAAADGNPLFVEEALAAFLGEDRDGGTGLAALVQARMQGLTLEARELLAAGAVIGRTFDVELVRAVTGRDEASIISALRALRARSLIVELDADRFRFRHELVRRAVSSGLLTRERRVMHAVVARELAGRAAGSPDAAAELSHHYAEAGEHAPALEHAAIAADRAAAAHAPRAAVQLYTRALECVRHIGAPPERFLLGRGHSYELLGMRAEARADLDGALAAARARDDAPLQARALLGLASLEMGGDLAGAGELLARALAVARASGDELVIADVLNRRGNWLMMAAREPEAEELHTEALRIFERLGDRQGAARTEDLLGVLTYSLGRYAAARVHLMRCIEAFEDVGDRLATANPRGIMAMLCPVPHGNTIPPQLPSHACESLALEAIAIAREAGSAAAEVFALGNLGVVMGVAGRYGEAFRAAGDSIALATEIDHPIWVQRGFYFRGAFEVEIFDHEAAIADLDEAVVIGARASAMLFQAESLTWRAEAAIATGRLVAAERDLARAAELAGSSPMSARARMTTGARLALARGDATGALAMCDELIATTPEGGVVPRLSLLRAEALLTLERPTEATTCLEEAADVAARFGLGATQWRIHASLARALVASGDPDGARDHVAVARAGIERIADGLEDERKARRFRDGASILLPRFPGRRTQHGPTGLTRRETEVAALVARGLANKQIAGELVIAPQTVETHVKRILAKLGFSSRAQIASWATSRGLASGS